MKQSVLVTGATGFVGSRLAPALKARGVHVRCGTRRLEGAPLPESRLHYVRCDLDDPPSVRGALEGCEAAYYLVHSIGEEGYSDRELEHASTFARACERTGVDRIIYLGGVQPRGEPSRHLRSRAQVGEILRGSAVKTIELRAGLIVGHGSTSWRIVRDLAERLPAMVLPRWTESRLQPVAIDDVVFALVEALTVPLHGSQVEDLPGPEALSVREILERVARLRGKAPVTVRVPLVTPWLSSLWLRVVSNAGGAVAEELVQGLDGDLLAHDRGFWPLIRHEADRLPFEEAVLRAFEDEQLTGTPGLAERALERLAGWMTRRAA